MAKKKIKLRARLKDGIITVKALIKHPMETGLRKNKETGEIIPAHHITQVTCRHKNELLFSTQWGPGVSKNPFISFYLKGIDKGEILTLAYIDNKDQTDSADAEIK
ncbi:MAG: thiosulfate oxidation carrier complex protein SoxZ [Gammaproteobacteria bacterium]|nr:thiosulfate oxidation carrier complex protein SoxZ [Gammaproteobacteria bacterium]